MDRNSELEPLRKATGTVRLLGRGTPGDLDWCLDWKLGTLYPTSNGPVLQLYWAPTGLPIGPLLDGYWTPTGPLPHLYLTPVGTPTGTLLDLVDPLHQERSPERAAHG